MGKQKDWLIDWLEDVGYELGYDLENHHEVDKLTVIEYLREAYIIKDSNKQRELIKVEREEKIRAIVRSEMENMYKKEDAYTKSEDKGLIEHLASFSEHQAKKDLEE